MGYYPKFAKRLNKYLEELDRSGSWLAKRVGVSATAVSRWRNEKSRPDSPETVIRLADILGVYDQKKQQELLVAAGYGYQAAAPEPPSESKVSSGGSQVASPELLRTNETQRPLSIGLLPEGPVRPVLARAVTEPEIDESEEEMGLLSDGLPLKPPSYTQLVGVKGHLSRLSQVLMAQEAPWLICISGIGGIGKTSLADALVRQVMKQGASFKLGWVSGQLSLFNLGGGIKQVNKPALTVPALVTALVSQLTEVGNDLSYKQALAMLQSRLKEQAHLIVIDNLETMSDLSSLLPTLRYLAGPTKFLLTSRESLFAEPDVYHFSVPELSQENALRLVRQQAKARNLPHLLECDDEVLKPIYDTVGGNPMALRLVVGQTYIHHLSVVLSDLAAARGASLNLYTHIYRRAWDHLDEATRRLLLVMPLVTSQGGSLDYIKHVSQLEPHLLRQSLHLLVSLNLIDVQRDLSAWRYTIHQLTRTFLQEQVTQWLSSSAESGMDIEALFHTYIRRSAEYVLAQAKQAATSLPLEVREQALHTLSVAYDANSSVPAAIWPVVRDLLAAIAPKMEQAGHRDEWMGYLERAIRPSQQLGDVEAQAELHFHLGVLHHHQAQFDEARRQFSSSATHFEQLGKLSHQARALNRLASVAWRQQRFEQAFDLAHTALGLGKQAKEELGYSYSVLGAIAFDKREWQDAIDSYSKSLALWEEAANQRLIAWGLGNLGKVLRKLERYSEAITCYEKAINLFEAIQDPVYQAVARMNLGNVYLKLGQPHEALSYYLLAEAIFKETYAQLSLAQVHFNKGLAYEKLQRWDKAEEVYRISLAQWQQIGTISSVVKVMARLGAIYLAQKRTCKAIETFQDALNKLTQIENEPVHHHLLTLLTSHLEEARQQS